MAVGFGGLAPVDAGAAVAGDEGAELPETFATAHAAAPTPESIEKLLQVTSTEKLVGSVHNQVEQAMKASMAQTFKAQKLDANAQKLAEDLSQKISDDLKDELSWEKLKPIYVQVYGETFTQEEIDGLIAFYESASGKAFVAKMPVVMQKTMALMQQRMGPVIQRMQKSIQDTVAEAKAQQQKGAPATPAPATP